MSGSTLHHPFGIAIIFLQDAAIDIGHPLARKRAAFFHFLMQRKLEFGKHRLAEERGADQLEALAQIIKLLRLRLGMRHHIIVEQHLVADRGRLGDEGRIR